LILHIHEWGSPHARPLVCLHGISVHGRRFRRLAEERLAARFRVLAPDLRGHGRSGWEPPWTLRTHVEDLLETTAAAGVERATWLGHSYGGRIVLELAAREPARIERAVLLDPAIQILPHVGLDFAEKAREDPVFASPEEAVRARLADLFPPPPELAEEDVRDFLDPLPDGRYRYRRCASAVVSGYGELCSEPPPPSVLQVPTLLVHAPAFSLVREEQLEAYAATLGGLLELVSVPGGHMVYWDAYEETADAVERFLSSGAAE
jgi:lipase